jgi:hypothetical protein
VEGAGFLQYSPAKEENFPISDSVKVARGQDYYLSFMINTINLVGGSGSLASVDILGNGGAVAGIPTYYIAGGKDWHRETIRFNSGNNSTINIGLGASGGGSSLGGYIYVDDIKIAPVLEAKEGNQLPIPQSCRLFPKEDSLSCDYYDESGMRLRGDYGYCLEYDRPPGDPNTCLLWWPIDRVSGQGEGKKVSASEVRGYEGPAPLFYCVGAATNQPYLNGSEIFYSVDEHLEVRINGVQMPGYTLQQDGGLGGREHQRGNLGAEGVGMVPLNFGQNTIELVFRSDTGTGQTFLRFLGSYHFTSNNGGTIYEATRFFDFVQMFKDVEGRRDQSPCSIDSCANPLVRNYADGSSFSAMFSCAGPSADNGVRSRTCDLTGDFDCWPGDGNSPAPCDESSGEYITGQNGCNSTQLCDDGGSDQQVTLTYTFNIPYQCLRLAQVVDRNGLNKAWVERLKESTDYIASCNSQSGMPGSVSPYARSEGKRATVYDGTCDYDSDDAPFGSIVPPAGNVAQASSPGEWAALINSANPSPLPYRSNSGRMGQIYSGTNLSYLFAESYGIWDWNDSSNIYTPSIGSPFNWDSPLVRCDNNLRINKNQNCSIAPKIDNIKINNKTANAEVLGRGFINLSFTSEIDPQQMPLTSYEIDWGDGEKLVVSGSDMRAMSDPNNPHSTYHAYDYWDMYSKSRVTNAKRDMPTLTCNDDYCTVKPKIKIIDNWGWCTEGYTSAPCPTPATAVCISDTGVVGAPNDYCLDYVPGDTASCPASFKYCGDGYYETKGIITVRNYVGE